MKAKSIVSLLAIVLLLVLAVTSCEIIDRLNPTPEEHNHTWKDATCIAPRTCTECGETDGEALGHAEELVPGKAATCTQAGFTEGKICSVCNEVTQAQEEIPVAAHTEETIPGKAATCTETGLTDGKKCSVCGETTLKQEEIPVAAHTEETIPGKAATCTETGLTDGIKCSVCDETLIQQEVTSIIPHTEETVAGKAATCTETGLTDGKKCSVCGKTILEQETIPVVAHTEEAVPGKAATCTETGLTEGKKCSVCGETLLAQKEIPASHVDLDGNYECDVCKGTLCVTHSPADPVKENEAKATCEAGGSYESVVKCANCGLEISRDLVQVDPLGHKMVGVVENSVKTYSCENGCGKTEVKYLVTVNHLYIDGTVAADADVYEYDNNYIYTVNAKAVEGYTASHEYVKGHILGAGDTITIYYSEINVWDGTVATAFDSGSGTESDPYIIKTGAQLAYLAKLGMDGTEAKDSVYGTGIYYKLAASIDLSNHQWIPIAMYDKGYSWTYFDGHFDGANHKIIINISNTSYGYGLFAGLGAKSVVKDLTLYGNISTAHRAGALAYITQNGARIENVTNYASINCTGTGGYVGGIVGSLSGADTVMTNCVNYGSVYSAGKQVGGLIGTTPSVNVSNCVNFGDVTCTTSTAGGISGTTTTAVLTECVNYGTIKSVGTVGGIVGNVTVSSKINNSVNYGTVNSTGTNAGGIGGYIGEGGKITDCVNYGAVTNTGKQTGGILGQNKGDIANCDNYGTITGVAPVDGINGVSTGTAENCNNYGEVVTK